MLELAKIGSAVVGTGFIGSVHVQSLRRLGVDVRGILGSSAERGKQQAAEIGCGRAYKDLDDLLSDEGVDVVHVASPNYAHYDQVKRILASGRNVICEKPLAMTSVQSAEMAELAAASGKIAAVCYNLRYYALNQQAQGMVAAGELGDIRLVSGHYHQDWLAKPSDWNWRLEADLGGALRSVSDIGTHWIDLASFITGLKVEAVFAELATFIHERQKPIGPVASFSAGVGETKTEKINTDDSAMIIIRFENGARGVLSTSQINMGRKNSLQWDIAGSLASAAWDSETPDHLFIGHRDRPNETLMRDFTLMNDTGVAATMLPPGHVEGFADSFLGFFRAVYSDVAAGGRREGSNWATFGDGHYEMKICDAILRSARESRWVELSEI